MKMSSETTVAAVAIVGSRLQLRRSACQVPVAPISTTMPMMNPTSPSLVTRKALTAAAAPPPLPVLADQQVRAEPHDLPADDQHHRSPATTTASIAAVNSETKAA